MPYWVVITIQSINLLLLIISNLYWAFKVYFKAAKTVNRVSEMSYMQVSTNMQKQTESVNKTPSAISLDTDDDRLSLDESLYQGG